MNPTSTRPESAIKVGIILRWVVLALLLAAAGMAYVHVKNQQHALGVETRKIEAALRDLRALNQVLGAEITNLTSHAQLNKMVSNGELALVPISGQYVARLTPPVQSPETGELRTASAVAEGEFTP